MTALLSAPLVYWISRFLVIKYRRLKDKRLFARRSSMVSEHWGRCEVI